MTISPEMPGTEIDAESEKDQMPDIDQLRAELDNLDNIILGALYQRRAVSQAIGKQRMAEGGPRIIQSREMAIIERYSTLGKEGRDMALAVLAMGRGRLGRSE